jgi:hypothetical protein
VKIKIKEKFMEESLSVIEKRLQISRSRIKYLQKIGNEYKNKIKNISSLVDRIDKDIKRGDSGYYTVDVILSKLKNILNRLESE